MKQPEGRHCLKHQKAKTRNIGRRAEKQGKGTIGMFTVETERLSITEFTPEMAQAVHENSLDAENRRFIPDEVFETEEEARETVLFLSSRRRDAPAARRDQPDEPLPFQFEQTVPDDASAHAETLRKRAFRRQKTVPAVFPGPDQFLQSAAYIFVQRSCHAAVFLVIFSPEVISKVLASGFEIDLCEDHLR